MVSERIDDVSSRIHTREVTTELEDLGQQDLIIRKRGTINPDLGGQVRISAEDCAAVSALIPGKLSRLQSYCSKKIL